MKFKGFEQADFDLFEIEGFQDRMDALIEQLRPKFYDLADDLQEELSVIVEEPMHPHVAKHARRKTNPPNDSWVAWASNQRGYKMLPHFQITVWHTHVLVQWGIIYEAKNKQVFADHLLANLEEVKKAIPSNFQWSKDHMKPEGTLQKDMSDEDFNVFADRLKHNKNGEVMVGLVIPKEEVINMKPKEFYQTVLTTWSSLSYLHMLAK